MKKVSWISQSFDLQKKEEKEEKIQPKLPLSFCSTANLIFNQVLFT